MSTPYNFSSKGLAKETQRQLVVTLAAQSRDQAHVAAAAALDDRTDVLVILSREKTKGKTARDASILYFQRATDKSTAPERVHQTCLQTHRDTVKLYDMPVDTKDGYRKDSGWIAGLDSKGQKKIKDLKKLVSDRVRSLGLSWVSHADASRLK